MRAKPPGFRILIGLAMLTAAAHADDSLPPPIGSIDFYGLGSISRSKAMAQLPFKIGDRLERTSPKRKGDSMARALGVARVEFAFICCLEEGKVQAYVGIEPRSATPAAYNAAPSGKVELPAEIVKAYDDFETAIREAVLSGNAREDHSQGHASYSHPPLRAQQEKFIAFAATHTALLRDVLANSADAKSRAVAAEVLGYAPDKREVVGPLSRASLDVNENVRNDATRALGVIAGYSLAHPELGIRIDAAPFIALMNSVVWTDRNKGSFVLTSLTATREPALLQRLNDESLPALVDMCGWTNLGHAFGACLILQRVLGMSETFSEQTRAEALERGRGLVKRSSGNVRHQ
jgi:hypothetical protein